MWQNRTRVDPHAPPDQSRHGARADPSATRRTGRGRGPRIGCRDNDRAYEAGDRDLKLQQHHVTLRVREQGAQHVQTVKASDITGVDLISRGEWEEVIAGDPPDLDTP